MYKYKFVYEVETKKRTSNQTGKIEFLEHQNTPHVIFTVADIGTCLSYY